MWCLASATADNRVKVIGLVEFGYLPTNGNAPDRLFDRAGKRRTFEEIFKSLTAAKKNRAESGPRN
jgi:hypothetical protein